MRANFLIYIMRGLKNSLPFVFLILSCLFPVIYLYGQNASVVSMGECLLPALVFLAIASAAWIVSFVVLRVAAKATLAAMLAVLLFATYRPLEQAVQAVFPNLYYWHILPISIFVLIHIVWLIRKKLPDGVSRVICVYGSLIMGVLIILNIIPVVSALSVKTQNIDEINENEIEETTPSVLYPESATDDDMPNIYLMVFDEFPGFEQLRDEFAYDESDFEQALTDLGFAFSRYSHSEYYLTVVALTNLLNLDYVVNENMTGEEITSLIQTPRLFQEMRRQGYIVQGIGQNTRYLPSINAPQGEAATIRGETFEELLLDSTMAYPLRVQTNSKVEQVRRAFSYIQDDGNIPVGPTFSFFYISSPHSPYVFDANGNDITTALRQSMDYKDSHLDQTKYTSKEILKTAEILVNSDPDSVIIVMSDHGYRYFAGGFEGQLIDEEGGILSDETDISYATNILNAVYYRGDPLDEISGQSGINTLRIVLNRLFGEELPMLEESKYDEIKG